MLAFSIGKLSFIVVFFHKTLLLKMHKCACITTIFQTNLFERKGSFQEFGEKLWHFFDVLVRWEWGLIKTMEQVIALLRVLILPAVKNTLCWIAAKNHQAQRSIVKTMQPPRFSGDSSPPGTL